MIIKCQMFEMLNGLELLISVHSVQFDIVSIRYTEA